MVRRVLAGLALLCVMPLAAGAATITVTVSNFQFSPKDITIALHDVIHWTMPANGSHTVTYGSGSGDPDAGSLFDHALSGAGASFDYTFDTAGDFPYYCAPHEGLGMTGVIRVSATSVQPTAWAKIKKLYR